MRRILHAFHFVIPVLFLSLLVWSYTQTDRALYYSSSKPFVLFQNWLWTLGNSHLFSTVVYVVLVLGLYACWIAIIQAKKIPLSRGLLAICALFLLLCNPALSYDLYNYMFDARLVLHYHFDPHTTSAITFQSIDPWVSYMRNTFFPTTYGYMWTAVSLIPGFLGAGKFSFSFVLFKVWSLIALVLMFVIDRHLLRLVWPKASLHKLAIFFLNPLVLIETLMNAHNDIWMMVLAHLGVLLLFQSVRKASKIRIPLSRSMLCFIASLVLLGASTQIKRATLLLLPVWVMILCLPFIQNRLKGAKINVILGTLQLYWADIAGLLLFLPLLTDLSRQFHPWYLLWSFSFVPFMRSRYLRSLLSIFTLTSALRYIPILWVGVYSEQLMTISKMITWSALPFAFLYWIGLGMMKRVKLRPTL